MHIPKLAIPILLSGFLSAMPLSLASNQETMHLVYAALTKLLPLALNEASFDNQEHRDEMNNALLLMERAASSLRQHTGSRDMEFGGLARSFENNVILLQQMLQAERRSEFNYLTLDLTQNCVSCHARLPADNDFKIAANFSNQVLTQLSDPLDKVQILIATRQFDAALSNLEKIIHDPENLAVDLELDGVLFDYLSVGVQVTEEFTRLGTHLRRFISKPGVPYYLKRYAAGWVERLEINAEQFGDSASLDDVRRVFNAATILSPVPNAQSRLIDDLIAASLIRRLLESDTVLEEVEKSELYWMLGVISIRSVNPRPGVPQTEVLLEAAIRNGPGSVFAKHSYALLEEFNRVSFAGIPVAELPDTLLDLKQLKELSGAN